MFVSSLKGRLHTLRILVVGRLAARRHDGGENTLLPTKFLKRQTHFSLVVVLKSCEGKF